MNVYNKALPDGSLEYSLYCDSTFDTAKII